MTPSLGARKKREGDPLITGVISHATKRLWGDLFFPRALSIFQRVLGYTVGEANKKNVLANKAAAKTPYLGTQSVTCTRAVIDPLLGLGDLDDSPGSRRGIVDPNNK